VRRRIAVFAAGATIVVGLLVLSGCALIFPAPMVDIHAEPLTGFAPLAVDFDATDSSGLTTLTSFSWDWGDGTLKGRGKQTQHTFAAGEHRVVLTATDTLGLTSQGTVIIRVHPDLDGRWSGALISSPSDDRALGIRLDLQRDGTSVTGSITVGVLGQPAEILITEGEATYERLYILAEGNALRTIPVTFYSIEIEAVPGEILSGEMTINDQKYDFLAQKN